MIRFENDNNNRRSPPPPLSRRHNHHAVVITYNGNHTNNTRYCITITIITMTKITVTNDKPTSMIILKYSKVVLSIMTAAMMMVVES